MRFNPLDYTTVFLSYDEPNCEENYRHLLSLNPQTLRVHGVKGSDTAHKEVAKLSKTDSVIVIDADNFVKPDFFTTTFDLPETYNPNTNVLSFSADNSINRNRYGNGSIKVWPVKLLQDMRTHENGSGVDFDLSLYTELDYVASEIRFASDFQAFRAGFREGVKLLLENDQIKELDEIDYRNFDRLWMWAHVGSDMKHGLSSIYGARLAMYWMLTQNYNHNNIIDFDNLDDLYNGCSIDECNRLFSVLKNKTNHWFFCNVLDERESERIRFWYFPPARIGDNIKSPFLAWAFNFRKVVRCNDENEINKLCTIGRSERFGSYLIEGARQGKLFKEQHKNRLDKIFDYSWLKEKYDRLYTDTI
jgi:hypothetical protein